MLFYGLKNKITSLPSEDFIPSWGLSDKILALNDIAVMLTASKNKIVHCTRSIEPLLGIPASEILEGGWEAIFCRIHPVDQKLLQKELHPQLRRQLRRLCEEDRLKCSFNYMFRIRNAEGHYALMALENQPIQLSDRKNSISLMYMSVLKNIAPYAARDQIVLSISRRSPQCGWETLFERRYPLAADGFTPRETQIMRLVAEGLSSNEIAERLFISAETVRAHRKRLLRKSGCKSSAELVSLALREQTI